MSTLNRVRKAPKTFYNLFGKTANFTIILFDNLFSFFLFYIELENSIKLSQTHKTIRNYNLILFKL